MKYTSIRVDDLLADSMKFNGNLPLIVRYGENFSVTTKGNELKVTPHESEERPYRLTISSFGIVAACVFFDDDPDLEILVGIEE